MKKLMILAVASSALMAGTAQAALQHGFEVGARGGYAWDSGHELNVNSVFNNANGRLDFSKDVHDNGGVFGVFAGYNWLCNELLLGVDLSADWKGNNDRTDFLTRSSGDFNFLNSVGFERDWMYGISGRMGYKAYDFMTPFVRLGLERVRNKLAYDLDFPNPPAATQRILGFEESKHKTGYLVGLGMDIPVFNKHTNVRVEYQYHWQNRVKYDFANAANVFDGSADMKPRAHFLTIGLLWSQI